MFVSEFYTSSPSLFESNTSNVPLFLALFLLPPFSRFHPPLKGVTDEVISEKYDSCWGTKREHQVGACDQGGRDLAPEEAAAANNHLA